MNAANLAATLVHFLTFRALPAADSRGRPLFAYGALLHNLCERRPHFEFGEFVLDWGDEGAQKGWCLYKMGCKGPQNFSNCATVRYDEGTSWPVQAGHGCIGCHMPGFWDQMGPAYARLPSWLPFNPDVSVDSAGMLLVGGVAALAVGHGAASMVRARRRAASERRLAAAAVAGPDVAIPAIAIPAIAIPAIAAPDIAAPVDATPVDALATLGAPTVEPATSVVLVAPSAESAAPTVEPVAVTLPTVTLPTEAVPPAGADDDAPAGELLP
jgi:hypothetical protein